MPDPGASNVQAGQVRWKFNLGVALFILGLICPVFIPLVLALDLNTKLTAVLTGLLSFGLPEVFWIIAAMVMGKEGFGQLKKKVWGIFKKAAPPDRVGPVRYAIGLVIFSTVLLFAWAAPYVGGFLPVYEANPVTFGLTGDGLLLVSLFILGGDFWDKLRALFIRRARVELTG